ncbi:unnamed protein product [Boreogadus saida]
MHERWLFPMDLHQTGAPVTQWPRLRLLQTGPRGSGGHLVGGVAETESALEEEEEEEEEEDAEAEGAR